MARIILAAASVPFAVWLSFSFIGWQINPAEWDAFARFLAVVFVGAFSPMAAVAVKNADR